jgi:hypothetical protein
MSAPVPIDPNDIWPDVMDCKPGVLSILFGDGTPFGVCEQCKRPYTLHRQHTSCFCMDCDKKKKISWYQKREKIDIVCSICGRIVKTKPYGTGKNRFCPECRLMSPSVKEKILRGKEGKS